MKGKWYLGLVVMCCALMITGSAIADPTYWMTVTGGQVFTGPGSAADLNAALPIGSATIPPDFTNAGTWDLAGYWQFAVTGSTADTPGSNWNEVFAGGLWNFQISWEGSVLDVTGGSVAMPPAIFNQYATWADMYGQWFENNPNMYTYFGLYVDPASGAASTPGTAPVGIFAFVGNSQYANFDNISGLMQLGDPLVEGGTGIATASVPEPATMMLFGLGLMGVGLLRRRS